VADIDKGADGFDGVKAERKQVDQGLRNFLKAIAAGGVGTALFGAGYLTGRRSLEEEFRQKFTEKTEQILQLEQAIQDITTERNELQAQLDQLSSDYDRVMADYNRAQDIIHLSDSLETETAEALSLYRTKEKEAINELYRIVASYAEELGDDRVKAEKTTADILSTTLDQRTKLEQTISEKQQEIEKLSKQVSEKQKEVGKLLEKLEEISKSGYIIFEANFSPNDLHGFKFGIDASVGCPRIPVTAEDGKMEIVSDDTSPQENGFALQLTSNVRRIPGLHMLGIASADIPFIENSTYIFGGFFRVVKDVQTVQVNLSRVEDYVERFAEVIWLYAPEFGSEEGDVVIRNSTFLFKGTNNVECMGNCTPIKIANVEPDNNWHYFEIEVDYKNDGDTVSRIYRRAQFDGCSRYLNLEAGKFMPKSWKESFNIYLSSGNRAIDFKLCEPYVTQDITRFARPFIRIKRS
jgi:cell division protein FtsB